MQAKDGELLKIFYPLFKYLLRIWINPFPLHQVFTSFSHWLIPNLPSSVVGWQPPQPEKSEKLEYVVRRNRFHEFEIWEEERASEFYDLNYDNRYEDKYDKMLRQRDPSLDIPFTHLSNCSGDIFKLRFVFSSIYPHLIEFTLYPNLLYPKYELI